MPSDVTVEKEVTAVRHVVRRGNETLWWGQVESRRINLIYPTCFVFAISREEAYIKIRIEIKKLYPSSEGFYSGPYEVELPGE